MNDLQINQIVSYREMCNIEEQEQLQRYELLTGDGTQSIDFGFSANL